MTPEDGLRADEIDVVADQGETPSPLTVVKTVRDERERDQHESLFHDYLDNFPEEEREKILKNFDAEEAQKIFKTSVELVAWSVAAAIGSLLLASGGGAVGMAKEDQELATTIGKVGINHLVYIAANIIGKFAYMKSKDFSVKDSAIGAFPEVGGIALPFIKFKNDPELRKALLKFLKSKELRDNIKESIWDAIRPAYWPKKS